MKRPTTNEFAFGEVEFRDRAQWFLATELPDEAVDLTKPAKRSDDDLNREIGATFDPPKHNRLAAVLVVLVKRATGLTMLLTTRTQNLSNHAGQIAFPGGKVEDDDVDPVATALREAQEETGLAPELVEPLGFLDIYQTRTGFRIVPVVAFCETNFDLRPQLSEVADIFEVPLAFLMNPANHQKQALEWQGHKRYFYAMPYGDKYIWGATAGIIRNLYDLVYQS